MTGEYETALKAASESLAAIQTFDAKSIVRAEKLGSAFDFAPAEEAATELVVLFRQVDLDGLKHLPISALYTLQQNAEATRQFFQQTLDFDRLCCTNGLTVGVPLSPDRLIPRPL